MAAKKFKIKYMGIDGNSTDSFATLAEAGKFLSDRYQGADYLSGSSVMGTDYAKYVLVGFNLNDVGKFDYSEGYKEYQFYDWAGGKLVEIKKFTVVQWSDNDEYPSSKLILASFDGLEQAIAKAIELCDDYNSINVEEDGKDLGYAVDKQWIDNVPFEQVAFPVEESEPPPF